MQKLDANIMFVTSYLGTKFAINKLSNHCNIVKGRCSDQLRLGLATQCSRVITVFKKFLGQILTRPKMNAAQHGTRYKCFMYRVCHILTARHF